MWNAREPRTVLHLGTARRQVSWERSERDDRYWDTDELRYELVAAEQSRDENLAILKLIRYWIVSRYSCSNAFEPRCSFESTTQRASAFWLRWRRFMFLGETPYSTALHSRAVSRRQSRRVSFLYHLSYVLFVSPGSLTRLTCFTCHTLQNSTKVFALDWIDIKLYKCWKIIPALPVMFSMQDTEADISAYWIRAVVIWRRRGENPRWLRNTEPRSRRWHKRKAMEGCYGVWQKQFSFTSSVSVSLVII